MNETESPRENVPEIIRGLMRDRSAFVNGLVDVMTDKHPMPVATPAEFRAEIADIDRRVTVLIGYGDDKRLSAAETQLQNSDPYRTEREKVKQDLQARMRACALPACGCGGEADMSMISYGNYYTFEALCKKCFKTTDRMPTPEDAATQWTTRKDERL